MHNLESDYHKSIAAESGFLRNIGHRLTARQYERAETDLLREFDFIYTVSQSETSVIENRYPDLSTRLRWVPPIAKGEKLPRAELHDKTTFIMSYFGDLTLPNNFGGLQWFCFYILPLLDKDRYRLHIAGKGSDDFNRFANVRTFGYVDSIDDFLAQSHLIVAPILSGGGVKIKVLDAMVTGKPVLTTSKGSEGLPLDVIEKMSIASSAEEWCAKIRHIATRYSQACDDAAELRRVAANVFSEGRFLNQLLVDIGIKNASSD
jgi:glycosyltransferase involved in cell wall biosynthesis